MPCATAGVDLAAEPKGTAIAQLEWFPAEHRFGTCPFGWPAPFVAFLAGHDTESLSVSEDLVGLDWRRTVMNRETDLHVRRITGRLPLSVSADKIAARAMRCASLLARLAAEGRPIDRSGDGAVVEVYRLHRYRGGGCRAPSTRVSTGPGLLR